MTDIEALIAEINSVGSAEIGKLSAEAVMSYWEGTKGLPRRTRRRLIESFALSVSDYYVRTYNPTHSDDDDLFDLDDEDL